MQVEDVVIEVRDENLDTVGQITSIYWEDVLLNPKFNSLGFWSLSLPSEHPLVATLRTPGSGIVVHTPGRVISGFMDLATNNADAEDPQATWTFEGTTDETILDDPLAYPTPSVADPAAQVDEYNVRTGAAETIIREYIIANIGTAAPLARRNPYITLAADGARGGSQTYSAKWDILLELIQDICARSTGLGFRVYQLGSGLQFECYVPQDRTGTVRMNIMNGTLDSTKYQFSSPKLTHAIVGGQGDGPYREYLERTTVGSLAAAATWHRRRERFVDARSADNTAEMQAAGDKELLESGASLASVAVTPSDDLTMIYGIDWDLGDKVLVEVDGQDVTAIVTEIIITINSKGVMVAAKVGDPAGFDFESVMADSANTALERIRDLERLVSTDPLLVRSRQGQISPLYTQGLLDVKFDGDVTYTSGIQWISSYIPVSGDYVSLQYSDGEWIVVGSVRADVQYLRPIELVLQSDWTGYDTYPAPAYAELTPVTGRYAPAVVTKSAAGWVSVLGIVYKQTATTVGGVIATLPVGFRPANDIRFTSWISIGVNRTITVKANGDIITDVAQAGGAGTYWNLGNILFNVSVATTLLSPLLNSWVAYGSSFGAPSYGKDAHGFVFTTGAMKSGGLADGVSFAALPAGYRPTRLAHLMTANGVTGGGIRAAGPTSPTNAMTFMAMSGAVNTFQGVDAGPWAEAGAAILWRAPVFSNSWVNFDPTTFQPAGYYKRPDGMVVLQGLIKSGTIGATAFYLPEEYRPKTKVFRTVPSNLAQGVVTIGVDGSINPVVGSNVWLSLDGIMFPAGG